MESKPMISVIIPVYNTEKYLRTCLDSLLIQDFKNIEYILVDDGSTDSSLEICNEYKNKDDRFLVYHKDNGGPSSARNFALSVAKGEYITFVDSDDYVEPGAYSRLNELIIDNEQPDVIVFGANPFPRTAPKWVWELVSPRDVVYNKFEPKILFEEIGTRPFLWLQMVKKNIITKNKLKFDESMDLGEDQLFQISYFMKSSKVVFISDRLYHYRVFREESLMSKYSLNLGNKVLKHIKLIEKVFKIVFSETNDIDIKIKLFNWSIFFLWPDMIKLLTIEQTKCSQEVMQVWKNFKCDKLLPKLDIWGQSRFKQISLMSSGGNDFDLKIQNYKIIQKELEDEISILESSPRYKKIKKNKKNHDNKLKKLFREIKNNGLKVTIHKIKNKLKTR